MNLFTMQKQTYRHRKQVYDYQGEMGWERDKSGVQDQQIQSTRYKIDGQQGPTV